ncbi:MAG: S1 RNA-binding domain-containing protein [Chloroflexi bacterium]|nr:S1 RNA-binding domain-containing protein [Chloroflexota bacterium]
MEDLLRQSEYDFVPPKAGDIRQGKIVSIESSRIAVDIGGKKEGIIPSGEIEKLAPELRARLAVGQELNVYIVRGETSDEEAVLSLNQAKSAEDWIKAETMHKSGEIFEGVVSTFNKGGLIVPFGRLRGFIPASQVASRPPGVTVVQQAPAAEGQPPQPIDDSWLQKMVGMKLPLKVIEVDQARRRLIFSERQAVRQWRKSQRERLMEELQEGQVRSGRVSNLTDFGAFVDLGGVDGLIHVSEISYERVKHPSDALHIGQEVSVMVMRIERDKGRIGLSIKRTRPDPWSNISDRYQRGQSVEGTVTNVTDFGAFVQLEPGVEGLVHVSEMQGQPRLRTGEHIALRILNVDPIKQRISLEPKLSDGEGDKR